MSSEDGEIIQADVRAWVEAASNNPIRLAGRQASEIVLTAIGLAPNLKQNLVLKGGTLMALGFESERLTGDLDFTAIADPDVFSEEISDEFNRALPKAAAQLGYLDIACRVQSVKRMPRPQNFPEHKFPALLIRIGYAERGKSEERRLEAGNASKVIDVEVSFKDQVYTSNYMTLSEAGVSIKAFTAHEIIAEKIRALLQQPIRNRYRRQDVYDISFLTRNLSLTESDKSLIYSTFIEKCKSRDIHPTENSISDPEIAKRASADWGTLALELEELPPFEECFSEVETLYRSLPWPRETA